MAINTGGGDFEKLVELRLENGAYFTFFFLLHSIYKMKSGPWGDGWEGNTYWKPPSATVQLRFRTSRTSFKACCDPEQKAHVISRQTGWQIESKQKHAWCTVIAPWRSAAITHQGTTFLSLRSHHPPTDVSHSIQDATLNSLPSHAGMYITQLLALIGF